MLDVKITQGSYWKGAQIPYWIYMILVILPFTGAIGIDHLALRSPITAILKALSFIPLFGFWYFYDIAQATGEREFIEKYGIGIPFYGPVGIGAGMFSAEGVESPKETPRPWLFIAYALTTILSIAFPLNKFVIGDYFAGFVQLAFFVSVIGIPLVFAQGIYDVFNLLFNTKNVFEEGPARFPVIPASFIGSRFDKSVLGPSPLVVETSALGAIAKLATNATIGLGQLVVSETENTIKGVSEAVQGTATSAEAASRAITDTVTEGAKATEGLTTMLQKVPDILDKLPSAQAASAASAVPLAQAASAASALPLAQAGGALAQAVNPSLSTTALLFSVALLGFSGYVFYMFRNTFNTLEKSDDPPSEPRAVRRTSQAKQSES